MLVMRFFRIGKKRQPFFRIVITDKKNPPRGGRFVEKVGFWNPLKKEKNLKIERIKYWLSKGVKPSPSVYNLLVKEKVIEGTKIPVHKKSKKQDKKQISPEAPKEQSAELQKTEAKETGEKTEENKTESQAENKAEPGTAAGSQQQDEPAQKPQPEPKEEDKNKEEEKREEDKKENEKKEEEKAQDNVGAASSQK